MSDSLDVCEVFLTERLIGQRGGKLYQVEVAAWFIKAEKHCMTNKLQVLFVCYANDARSLIAEALLRHSDSEHFEAFSAGVKPTSVDPRTLSALEHAGIATEGLRSKPLEEFAGMPFDYLIDLCDKTSDELTQLPHSTHTITWSFADPTRQEGSVAFRHALQEIHDRIKLFLMVKSRPHDQDSD